MIWDTPPPIDETALIQDMIDRRKILSEVEQYSGPRDVVWVTNSITEPQPNETPSEYIERMLGPPETRQRLDAGDSSAYRYYLRLWDAHEAKARRDHESPSP